MDFCPSIKKLSSQTVYETQRNANVRELEIKGEIGNSVSQLK
jgi:hypothetical protein